MKSQLGGSGLVNFQSVPGSASPGPETNNTCNAFANVLTVPGISPNNSFAPHASIPQPVDAQSSE